eukprot:CAMPEP_0176233908 /NCGR_PEP_ID=MMETSP0121_2-20121125/26064_1 /TAXON_ID=160619 /ORGANISM="Kryptoperidinium foliaceum, Strain CCMP 1326" /LENGTH=543 /DNA_ID=CAMNT_0017573311 /DNA_START=45 /DNA_END=1676 /DNA_ORIENTATION=+
MAPTLRAVWAAALLAAASADAPVACRDGACRVAEDAEVSLLQRSQGQAVVDLAVATGGRCDVVGARAWVAQAGINYIVQTMFRDLIDKTFKLEFPEMKGEKGGWKFEASGLSMVHYAIDIPSIDITEGKGVEIALMNFHIDTKFHYKVETKIAGIPVWSAGTARAELSQKEIIRGFVTVGVNEQGKPKVKLELGVVAFKLGAFLVEGSIFEGLIEFLVSIFKERVENAIADAVRWTLETAVNKYLNDFISNIGLMLPLWRSGTSADAADMSLCYAEVGKGYLSFGVSGAVVDTSKGTRPVYLGAPPVLRKAPPPALMSGGHMLATEVTPYTVDTGLALLQAEGVLEKTVMPSDLANLKLNAETAKELVPTVEVPASERGMPQFAIHISSDKAPTVSFAESGAKVHGHVEMSLKWIDMAWVKNPEFLKFTAPFEGLAKVTVADAEKEEVMHMELESLSCSPITIVHHNVPNLKKLSAMIEQLVQTALLPYLNSVIKDGVAMPTGEGLQLTGSQASMTNGYLDTVSDIHIDMSAVDAFIDSAIAK